MPSHYFTNDDKPLLAPLGTFYSRISIEFEKIISLKVIRWDVLFISVLKWWFLLCIYGAAMPSAYSISVHFCCDAWWRHSIKPFPRYWPLVRGIHRSLVDSPHKELVTRALFFLCWLKQTVEQVIWEAMVVIVRSLWWNNRWHRAS